MNYSLVIRPIVEEHLTEGYNWYESKVAGLGEEFLRVIEARLAYIKRHPLHYQKKYKDVRIGFVDRFPYGVFYFIDNTAIIVLGILYLGKNPKVFKSLKK